MGRRAKAPYVQMNLGDSFLNLSSRGQKAIRQSRLGHFGDQVFDKIPYEDFAVIYSDKGRGPSDLIYLIAAHMIIVQEDITADEFFLRLDSDAAIQYAMHTTSCTKQPVSVTRRFIRGHFLHIVFDDYRRLREPTETFFFSQST